MIRASTTLLVTIAVVITGATLLTACNTPPQTPPSALPDTQTGTQNQTQTQTHTPTPTRSQNQNQTRVPDNAAQLSSLVARQERIYRLAAPLMVRTVPLCRTQARPLLGFTAKNRYSYPAELSAAAQAVLKLDEQLRVMQVLEGSGAMRAGIRPGDLLYSVQDQVLPLGAQAETEAARLVAPLLKNASSVSVTVIRLGQRLTLTVPLTTACAFSMDIGHASAPNAYADGRRIMITQGMLDFLTNDNELAVILAREIAHNVLQHAASLQTTATITSVIDALLPLQPDPAALASQSGLRPVPAKIDQEADRLAMYLLARAGYDPAATEPTLQKLALAYPASPSNAYPALHPWTAERRQLIQSTLTEIRQKQAAKKPLTP